MHEVDGTEGTAMLALTLKDPPEVIGCIVRNNERLKDTINDYKFIKSNEKTKYFIYFGYQKEFANRLDTVKITVHRSTKPENDKECTIEQVDEKLFVHCDNHAFLPASDKIFQSSKFLKEYSKQNSMTSTSLSADKYKGVKMQVDKGATFTSFELSRHDGRLVFKNVDIFNKLDNGPLLDKKDELMGWYKKNQDEKKITVSLLNAEAETTDIWKTAPADEPISSTIEGTTEVVSSGSSHLLNASAPDQPTIGQDEVTSNDNSAKSQQSVTTESAEVNPSPLLRRDERIDKESQSADGSCGSSTNVSTGIGQQKIDGKVSVQATCLDSYSPYSQMSGHSSAGVKPRSTNINCSDSGSSHSEPPVLVEDAASSTTPLQFNSFLLSISSNIDTQTFEQLKFLCGSVLPGGVLSAKTKPFELFDELSKRLIIRENNTKFLEDILDHIGRVDLGNKLRARGDRHSQVEVHLSSDQKRQLDFRKVLLSISNDITTDRLGDLKFILGIQAGEAEQITTSFQLFDLLIRQGRLSITNRELLVKRLAEIGLNLLSEEVKNYSPSHGN